MLNSGKIEIFTKLEKFTFTLPLEEYYNRFEGIPTIRTSYRYLEEQKSTSPSFLNSEYFKNYPVLRNIQNYSLLFSEITFK